MEARQNLWKNRRWSGLTSPCRVFTKTHPAVAAECTDWFFFFFLKNPLYLYAPVSALKPDRCEMKCSLSDFTSHTLYFWSVHLNTSSAARVKHLILPSLSLSVWSWNNHNIVLFVLSSLETSWRSFECWKCQSFSLFICGLSHDLPDIINVGWRVSLWPTKMIQQCEILSVVVVKCFCLLCVCVQNVSCKNCTIATSYQVTLLAICWSGKYWDFGNLC